MKEKYKYEQINVGEMYRHIRTGEYVRIASIDTYPNRAITECGRRLRLNKQGYLSNTGVWRVVVSEEMINNYLAGTLPISPVTTHDWLVGRKFHFPKSKEWICVVGAYSSLYRCERWNYASSKLDIVFHTAGSITQWMEDGMEDQPKGFGISPLRNDPRPLEMDIR